MTKLLGSGTGSLKLKEPQVTYPWPVQLQLRPAVYVDPYLKSLFGKNSNAFGLATGDGK